MPVKPYLLIGRKARTWGFFHQAVFIFALAGLYAGTGYFLHVTTSRTSTAVNAVFVPEAIALAAVILLGRRLCVGAALGQLILLWAIGGSLLQAVPVAAITGLTTLLGAVLFERFSINENFTELRDVGFFFALCVSVQVANATLSVTTLHLMGHVRTHEFMGVWNAWGGANSAAQLAITPMILLAFKGERTFSKRTFFWAMVGFLLITLFVFEVLGKTGMTNSFLEFAVFFPLASYMAIRFGGLGSATSSVVLVAVAIKATAAGHGPFSGGTEAVRFAEMNVFIGGIATMSLAISAEIEERKTLVSELVLANEALAETAKELKHLSALDGLTGIPNRRSFDDSIEKEWHVDGIKPAPLSVILIDVDHFKRYNDTYGHIRGDQCLTLVARSLVACASRVDDLVARYGGEEFVMFLPSTTPQQALVVAEKMRVKVEQLQIPHETSPTSNVVTISLGVASMFPTPNGGGTPLTLIESADCALYTAKAEGRNRVKVYDQPVGGMVI